MINSRVPSSLLVSRIATDIVRQQNSLASVQEQISTGKKINRPSDAPAQSAHLLTMKETISRIDQFAKNASIAESQLSLEEGALTGTTEALNRIRELALRANSGLSNDEFREASNSEIRLIVDELYALANTRDSFGNYLFSGSNISQQPFQRGNPVSYSGSDENMRMEVALGRTIESGDSGIDVFMRIRRGNGDFQVSTADTNQGTGIIDKGSVSDYTIYPGGEFEITFTSPNTYDITDLATGATLLTGESYEPEATISFNGMTTSISGAPDTGDSFKIEPSRYQDMFTSIAKLVDTLDESPLTSSGAARMRANIDAAIVEIDNAMEHMNITRSRVGTRLSSLESSREENENMALQIERAKRDIEDVDIADAVTRLQTQANSLEILQKSFTRIEGLSLFNFM